MWACVKTEKFSIDSLLLLLLLLLLLSLLLLLLLLLFIIIIIYYCYCFCRVVQVDMPLKKLLKYWKVASKVSQAILDNTNK